MEVCLNMSQPMMSLSPKRNQYNKEILEVNDVTVCGKGISTPTNRD
jgi:hypothetical protein